MNELIRVGKEVITVEGFLQTEHREHIKEILMKDTDKIRAKLETEIFLLREEYRII